MQNANYKDWMNMWDSNTINYRRIDSSPEAYVSAQAAISTGIGIVSKLLEYLGLGIVADAINITMSLVNTLWKEQNNTWDALLRHLEDLMNQKISDLVLSNANVELTALKRILNEYAASLENWKNNPNDPIALEHIKSQFAITHNFFVERMAMFAHPGYEVLLLSVYAQAANLHLLLLRDASIYGNQWGLARSNSNYYYERQLYYTNEYTNHCMNWYHNGLNRLRGTTGAHWLNFNRFRTEMTLTVLDIIALFPTYDYRKYPAFTKVELSRVIYTDPVIYDGFSRLPSNNAGNFNDFEREAIGIPSLTKWLKKIEISTGEIRFATNPHTGDWVTNVWNGNTNTFAFTDSSSEVVESHGIMTNNRTSLNMNNFDNFRVDLRSHCFSQGAPFYDVFGIGRSQFFNGRTNIIYDNEIGITDRYHRHRHQTTTISLPGANSEQATANDYSHRLADVRNLTGGLRQNPPQQNMGRSSLIGHGWTHVSMKRENILELDKITQIPAVKSNGWMFSGDLLRGSGHTGGDLVTLGNGDRYTLNIIFPAQAYRIRVRYASNGDGEMGIEVNGVGYTRFSTKSTFSHNNYNDLKFQDFNLVDTSFIYNATYIGSRNIWLYSYSTTRVIIDKIEFIPVGIFANQSFEETEGYNQNYSHYDQNMDTTMTMGMNKIPMIVMIKVVTILTNPTMTVIVIKNIPTTIIKTLVVRATKSITITIRNKNRSPGECFFAPEPTRLKDIKSM